MREQRKAAAGAGHEHDGAQPCRDCARIILQSLRVSGHTRDERINTLLSCAVSTMLNECSPEHADAAIEQLPGKIREALAVARASEAIGRPMGSA